ncbi:hypothetical protein HPB51_024264 [Rhipicephalus microplus]|uniref:Uncharacterized protein n=1 Tax=Rhipicephalus microplus TaxID=6941 RepID=A0A9J6EIY5_RHIMP|nr:hypothetical protein HPB51_024264 [Rhipicephalus microplus]
MYHTGGISKIGRLGLISKNNGRARELEPLLVKVRNEATRESNLDKGGKTETDSASTARLKGDREMSQTRRKAQDARRRCHMSPPPKWSLSPRMLSRSAMPQGESQRFGRRPTAGGSLSLFSSASSFVRTRARDNVSTQPGFANGHVTPVTSTFDWMFPRLIHSRKECIKRLWAPPRWSSGQGTRLLTHRSRVRLPAAAAAFPMEAELL